MLTDEHIIPLAANGDLILPQASCRKCQLLTWKPEEQLLLLSAKSFRVTHRYKSRRKAPKTLPLRNVNGTGETRQVPVDVYPNAFALFLWPKPWLLSGKDRNDSPMTQLWIDGDRRAADAVNLAKLGIHTWSGQEIQNEMVFRLFAKIGHSYLAAEIGLDAFKPTLLDYIHRRSDAIMPLIGGTEEDEAPTDDPYQISWRPQTVSAKTYAVVSARLFAPQMGPTFLIVAGEL
jgi:hypothetical protein